MKYLASFYSLSNSPLVGALTLIMTLLAPFILLAQVQEDQKALETNSIHERHAYIFQQKNSQDSFLITKEYFNPKGRCVKFEVYKEEELNMEYNYGYQDDTLRTNRITKSCGIIIGKTKLFYDHKYREIKAVTYDKNNKRTGTHSKIKYNDKKRTKENKIYFSGRLSVHTKWKYNQNGTVKSYKIWKRGRWVNQIDKNGKHRFNSVTEIENYQGTGLKLIKKKLTTQDNKIVLGIKGPVDLNLDDVLITEKFVDGEGLVQYEKQFLNEDLMGVKKYYYYSEK